MNASRETVSVARVRPAMHGTDAVHRAGPVAWWLGSTVQRAQRCAVSLTPRHLITLAMRLSSKLALGVLATSSDVAGACPCCCLRGCVWSRQHTGSSDLHYLPDVCLIGVLSLVGAVVSFCFGAV